jgi:branched-chain amino acid transport system permease protein
MRRLGSGLPAEARFIPFSLEVLLGIVLLLFPLADSSALDAGRVELLLVYLMSAVALNFVLGYGGEMSIGQPVMLTAAGYTTGILSIHMGWQWWITTPIAAVVSVAISVFMGLPGIRVRGWYLGVLGFLGVALIPSIANAFESWTGGTTGLASIIPVEYNGKIAPQWVPYEILLIFTILVWIASRNLISSGWGIALLAQRDHPHAASASGVNSMKVRAATSALAGIPCGIAGSLYASIQQFTSPQTFTTQTVLLLLGAVMLGGRGRRWGPVLGVAVFGALSLWVGPFSSYNPLILGCGVVIAALLFKGGVIGAVETLWQRYFMPKSASGRMMAGNGRPPGAMIAPIGTPPRLELTGVSKRFGGVTALDSVGLTVDGGTVLTVVGANGSGKTTLLNCVSGFVSPDAGQITLNGKPVNRLASNRRAHLGFARSFQVPQLVEELTVLDNVMLGAYGLRPQTVLDALLRTPRYRKRARAATATATAACQMVGLSERVTRLKVGELPLAVRRIVEIARALAADASIICLDEPVAGLNLAEQAQVSQTLRAIAASGRAVLLIEHNLPFVLSTSDHLILLRDGKIADSGAPPEAEDTTRQLGAYFRAFAGTGEDTFDKIPVEAEDDAPAS